MPRRCALAAFASVLFACAPPEPPASPNAPAPTEAPSSAPSAEPTVEPSAKAAPPKLPPRPKAPPIPLPPPITEALPPLPRPFSLVTLKGVKAQLISVSGRSARDVWFLSDEEHQMEYQKKGGLNMGQKGTLVHFDGKKVDKQVKHDCSRAEFSNIIVAKDGVILEGNNAWVRGVPSQETALYTGKGKKAFECWHGNVDLRAATNEFAWSFQWIGPSVAEPRLGVAGGPKVPLPSSHLTRFNGDESLGSVPPAWQMTGPDDGWMVWQNPDKRAHLLRFNGVTWVTKAALGDVEVTSMLVAKDGQVWMTASLDGADDMVLRFDGQTLHALPVPDSFKAMNVISGTGKELWFYGFLDNVYYYDGARLHAGRAPIPIARAWAAPNGEVWAVSFSQDEGSKGVVAHVGPLKEAR